MKIIEYIKNLLLLFFTKDMKVTVANIKGKVVFIKASPFEQKEYSMLSKYLIAAGAAGVIILEKEAELSIMNIEKMEKYLAERKKYLERGSNNT